MRPAICRLTGFTKRMAVVFLTILPTILRYRPLLETFWTNFEIHMQIWYHAWTSNTNYFEDFWKAPPARRGFLFTSSLCGLRAFCSAYNIFWVPTCSWEVFYFSGWNNLRAYRPSTQTWSCFLFLWTYININKFKNQNVKDKSDGPVPTRSVWCWGLEFRLNRNILSYLSHDDETPDF